METGSGTAEGAIELQAGNDGLGEWGGRRSRRGWRSIVMILTTHNGRLLHLQTMVVRYQRKRQRGQDTGRRESKKVGMKNKMWHSKIMQDLVVAYMVYKYGRKNSAASQVLKWVHSVIITVLISQHRTSVTSSSQQNYN